MKFFMPPYDEQVAIESRFEKLVKDISIRALFEMGDDTLHTSIRDIQRCPQLLDIPYNILLGLGK